MAFDPPGGATSFPPPQRGGGAQITGRKITGDHKNRFQFVFKV